MLTSLFSLFYVTGEFHRFFTPRQNPNSRPGGRTPFGADQSAAYGGENGE